MKSISIILTVALILMQSKHEAVYAQQYKIRQTTSMMGMKTESTIYVKGKRKRTEGGSYAGMGANIATIEQCDSQRIVKLNDAKKLYYIEPFAKPNEEIIDEDAPKTKQAAVKQTKPDTIRKGGVITQWYSIIDTNERKKMFGVTARHVWTSNKMKPSADACYMKDSMLIKTDGWYIDLPEFNCPVNYKPARTYKTASKIELECKDRFVTHRRGKGRLGFPLIETTTMIMGGSGQQTTEMTTTIETIEFSTAKLDSMLFEIPPGYMQVKSEEELEDKMAATDYIKSMMKDNGQKVNNNTITTETKRTGVIRIAVFPPSGDGQFESTTLQQQMTSTLNSERTEAVAVNSEEEAKKYNCDYTLSSAFTKIKAGSKVGGFIKALKNADPNTASSFNIEAGLTLKSIASGAIKNEQKVNGKYDGRINEAAGKALDEGCHGVLASLR
jgi:hypothetical protein